MTIIVAVADSGQATAEIAFTVPGNATWDVPFEWTFASAPLAIAGEIVLTFKDAAGMLHTFQRSNGRVLYDNADQGLWRLQLTESDAVNIPPGSVNYDVIEYMTTDVRVFRRQQGTITVEPTISVKPSAA